MGSRFFIKIEKKENNFKLKIHNNNKKSYALILTINDKKFKKIDNELIFLKKENVSNLENCIIECTLEKKKKVLIFLRKRNDKKKPNNLWVSKKIVNCIKENIKANEITEKIEKFTNNNISYVNKKFDTSLGFKKQNQEVMKN